MGESGIKLLLLTHAASTLFMTGLIWFVQVVHYPLMASVGKQDFTAYESQHTALTSWVVGPPMLIEISTAILLIWFRPASIPVWQVWLGMALLAVIWLSTAFMQVPYHNTLSKGFERVAHDGLVLTNWIRTAAWTLRSVLVLFMIYK